MKKVKTVKKYDILIPAIREIIKQYTTKLTLRQVYYRLVANQLIENKQTNYQYLSKLLVKARLCGDIPFYAIEDRTRGVQGGDTRFEEPENYFKRYLQYTKDCADDYEIPKWHYQDYHVEVWVEKQALEALFLQICDREKVYLSVVRGYPSLTFLKSTSQRFERYEAEGKKIIMLYFGDMDPSGQDIPRYIKDTLENEFRHTFEQIKCAITQKQIDKYKIPSAPAKRSDARFNKFVAEHGDIAVELDAIEPNVLQEIISNKVNNYWDEVTYRNKNEPENEDGQVEIRELVPKYIKDDEDDE